MRLITFSSRYMKMSLDFLISDSFYKIVIFSGNEIAFDDFYE